MIIVIVIGRGFVLHVEVVDGTGFVAAGEDAPEQYKLTSMDWISCSGRGEVDIIISLAAGEDARS